MARLTVPQLRETKGKRKLVTLSLGMASMAQAADEFCDALLVGDSINMTIYGQTTTRGITLDQMIAHGRAVVGATKRALVVVDLPFGTYEQSPEQAFANAARVLAETQCQAVKLEGGVPMHPTIRFLVERGLPVMGHTGLYPQHSAILGGFKKERDQDKVLADARGQQDAGVFSMVIEAVSDDIGRQVTELVQVPTIGIAAGTDCDGQILVVDDLLSLSPLGPAPFVKPKAVLNEPIRKAIQAYADEVRSKT